MSLFDIAVGVFEEKMKASVTEYVQGIMDKKKTEEIFDKLCAGQEGRALFENQGAVDGIDFYVLTNTLRTELIENALSYYREDDRRKAEDVKQKLYREVQDQTGAVTEAQEKAVTHFLEQVYKLTGFYLLKCLGREDRLAINISSVIAQQKIDKIHEEIRIEIQKIIAELKSDKAWELPIKDFGSYHETQKDSNGIYGLLKINDRLFPALSAWDGVQYLNEKGDSVPLYTCLSKEWKSHERKHLLLMGGGGMGKTVSLLRLWDKLLEDGICALYIPLHEIMGIVTKEHLAEDVIKNFITDSVWKGNAQKTGQFLDHLSESTDKPMFVLLLDGFNEVPSGNRRAAITAIKKWMVYSGVQVVISSRYDFRQDISVEALSELIIEPLSDEQVGMWFKLCKMPVPDKSEKVYDLLKTPFMLTLYTQVENRYNQGKDAKFVKWVEHADISSDLMWNFMQCQILKMANDHLKPDGDILKAVIASMYILPYICWVMEWKELFVVESRELNQWIREAVELYKNKWKEYPDSWVDFLEIELGDIQWEIKDFSRILIKELNLLINRDDNTYSLLHQNFRDFLAAVHLYYAVETDMQGGTVDTWERRPFSDNVVNFLAEWMPEESSDVIFQSLRGKQISEGNYIFFNLIRVIRKIKKDDLSGMDFSDMDLRSVVLNGARLVNGEQRAVFRNARINYGTLVMQGHNDKIYYVAFSEDGRQLISVSTFDIRIWDLTTGSCVHEIVEDTYRPGGGVQYYQPEFQKKIVMADGREFVWIGESETCTEKYIDTFKYLLQCSDGWKIESSKPYINYNNLRHDKESLERLFQYKKDSRMTEIQEDAIIVSLPTGEKRMLTGNQAMATCANLSKDMKYCAAGLENGSICIWDLESGRLTSIFPNTNGKICYAEGFDTIYIGQTSGIAMIWKPPYDACSYVLEGRKSPVTLISHSEKKNLCIVSHADDVVEIWDLAEIRIIKTMEHYQYISINEYGTFVCGKTSDGTVWCKNLETEEEKYNIWTGVDRNKKVFCDLNYIYLCFDESMDYAEKGFIPEKKVDFQYGGSTKDYNFPRIDCYHNIVSTCYHYNPSPNNIYIILNLNLFGCDFTGAVFETLELAAKVKSNGGILELPEEYHTRSLPEWARTTPAWLRTSDSD